MNWNLSFKSFIRAITPPVILQIINKTHFVLRQNLTRQKELSSYSEQYYNLYFDSNSRWRLHYSDSSYYFLWAIIADRICRDKITSVLDIGCGSGQLALLLHDKGLSNYCGIDFSMNMIDWAKHQCPDYTFIYGDVFNTELFKTKKYDVVVSTEFLEHVNQDLEVIKRIPKGTKFYGSVPNFPAKGHVRYFINTDEVTDRYKKYFNNFSVEAYKKDKLNLILYIIEGIKK